jgi:LAO/AO transport system kinase
VARRRLSTDALEAGVLSGDRGLLARAITLVESSRPADTEQANDLMERVMPHTGGALRVGISGVPGVGKSTLLDALGMHLLEQGHRPAVLAVDPSSALSGGSILGDKTRMERLAADPRAFIRPSPAAHTLGGVARRSHETLLLCEAAGFDVVLVETVGVGQSETLVADLVDTFVLLLLPGAGDELQGIKRGIVELADVLAVNKCDADRTRARRASNEYTAALRYLRPRTPGWSPTVQLVSGLTAEGLPELWSRTLEHRLALEETGALARVREEQLERRLWQLLREGLLQAFRGHGDVARELETLEGDVRGGRVTPGRAAQQLLARFNG